MPDTMVYVVTRGIDWRRDRFWARVDVRGEDDCWLWQGAIRKPPAQPYGWTSYLNHGITAHRLAWILTNGPIESSSIYVCHRCDNPPCVNPSHLFLGTAADNSADMAQKGRARPGPVTPQFLNSRRRFSPEQVRVIRRRFDAGESRVAMAAEYGVTKRVIYLIGRREAYKHVD